MKKTLLPLFLAFVFSSVSAQHADNPLPYFTYSKGLGITPPDSSFSLTLRFRIQNRAAMSTIGDQDLSTKEWELLVRRLRLRFDGFVYNPKFAYALQLSFSRGDMDWDNTNYPNIVRDAMFFYKANKHFTIGLGQTKLPGNRQRITSSGDQQFADRSNLNAIFNIDRDFGLQLYYDNTIGSLPFSLRGAASNGEGRNVAKSSPALMYSTRVEIFPLGKFSGGGDYFEGDLMHEPKPKLAIAGTYAFDEKTNRSGGTLGKPLFAERSFRNYGGDLLFKYKGWALSSELLVRDCPNPVTLASDNVTASYVYDGWGTNTELSYIFKNNNMLGSRFTKVKPGSRISAYEKETDNYTLVFGHFFKGHRLKLQSDLTYFNIIGSPAKNHWQARVQVEIGI